MMHGGFNLPDTPDEEQIETARLFLEQHRSDHRGRCPALTCAVGPIAPPWPCRRWRWAGEVYRRAGLPVDGPGDPMPPLAAL
jgi:hypothetical protein